MNRHVIAIIFLITSLAPLAGCSLKTQLDFDAICKISKQIAAEPGKDQQLRAANFKRELDSRWWFSPSTKSVLSELALVDPAQRYDFFVKAGAQSGLRSSWDCPELRTLLAPQ